MNETVREIRPDTVVWHLLIDRWHTTLRAKALSEEMIRGYLFTARSGAGWPVDHGHDRAVLRKWQRTGRTVPPVITVVK